MEYEYSKMRETESQGFKFITVDKLEVIKVREKAIVLLKRTLLKANRN